MGASTFKRDIESFKAWADVQNWLLLTSYEYDNGDIEYRYLTPNGVRVAVSDRDNMIASITPLDSNR